MDDKGGGMMGGLATFFFFFSFLFCSLSKSQPYPTCLPPSPSPSPSPSLTTWLAALKVCVAKEGGGSGRSSHK